MKNLSSAPLLLALLILSAPLAAQDTGPVTPRQGTPAPGRASLINSPFTTFVETFDGGDGLAAVKAALM